MNMKKFLSTRSSSPAQEKSKDCQSKAAATCVDMINSNNGYRIRGNRCASSIGGGVKTQSTEPDIIDSSCKNSPSRDIRSRHGIKECKVVLDRIDIPSGAVKLDEQEPCRNKTHLTSQFASSDTDDSFREKQIAKPPVGHIHQSL